MISMLEAQDPHLVIALVIGFLCVSSLFGGILRTLFAFAMIKRIFFIAFPFTLGAGGVLFLLN
jgi:hypothetical protein